MPHRRRSTWSVSNMGIEREKELEIVYGEDYVDVTDGVQCYEKGKTFTCECGLGHGVEFEIPAVKCPRCSRYCVDKDAGERSPPERDKSQKGLTDFA